MAESKAGSESVTGSQRRHAAPAQIPGCHQESADQPAGEYAARLQRVEAENLAPITGVSVPLIDDEKYLGPDDSGEHNQDSEIPRIIAVNPLLLRIPDADPQSD